ncbi:THUMP domain-containing protein [Pigmentiphaga soli]|uniref:THUMP domain-containing protein n=1 Tax=Pigmentiphaga soli TaxID=1007095 RepID=A0ABP8GZT7_9BURK
MSDSPERKKLSVRARTPDATAGRGDARRAGPRARRVAQAGLEEEKRARMRDATRADAAGDTPAGGSTRGGRDNAPSLRPPKAERRSSARPAAEGGFRPRNSPPRGPAAGGPAAAPAARPAGPETFRVFAPCPQGLEGALAAELQQLGFADVHEGRAGAHFSADWQGVMQANLHSRIAARILVEVGRGPVATEDDLLELARATPWERWFGAEQTLRVDTSAVRSPMKSLQYCNLRAKDGICDRLRDLEGERPSIDTVRPDARVHVFLSADTATLYLDTSGESLFKRGWRLDKGEAPLRENLAAGLLALSGWPADAPLLDPFCGSGTILIEAALAALKVPPGVSRPFAFERLRHHPERRWRDLKDDARSRILDELPMPLAGADLDPQAIDAARENARRAGLTDDAIYFETADARDTCPLDERAGWIVTNPPYGERLGAGDAELWPEWSRTLKREFGGWQLHVITNDFDLPRKLRLDPKRRIPMYNGALECRLFGFELVSGGFRR